MPPSWLSLHGARRFCLRNKRRVMDVKGVLERRKFKALRHEFYDTLWRDSATSIGAQVESRPNGLTQITRSGLATFVHQSDLMLDSSITGRLMLNKMITFELMAAKGLRIPRCCNFDLSTLHLAEEFMKSHAGAVVVKPADGTGCGHGVTTGIRTRAALHSASRYAAAFYSHLLVEEQLTGASFRLLYLDGVFIDAVRRDPPVVIGDGKSTVRQLADGENRQRRTRRPISALSPLILNQESRNTLAAAGKRPGSVPAAGEAVRVKLAVNENGSCQNHIVRDSVNAEIVSSGSALVRELGVRFAGIDVTADDISAPLRGGNTIFNEINVNPGIHHHYLVANPERSAKVAPHILEQLFSTRRGVVEL